MAQEEYFIAVVSERLSRPGDTRYVIIDKTSQQEVDNCNGRGYKSPQSAHKSFSFKQRQRGQGGQQSYGRTGYGQGYATRGAASQQTAVHAYRSTSDGHGRSTNRGQAAYGQTAHQVPMNAQPPRDLVSPFVQEASAGYQRQTVVRDDGAPAVTRVNSWSGYAPRRASAPRQAPRQAQPQAYQQQPSYARQTQPQAPTYPTRHHRRPQDVTQENTPPPPDLFGYRK